MDDIFLVNEETPIVVIYTAQVRITGLIMWIVKGFIFCPEEGEESIPALVLVASRAGIAYTERRRAANIFFVVTRVH